MFFIVARHLAHGCSTAVPCSHKTFLSIEGRRCSTTSEMGCSSNKNSVFVSLHIWYFQHLATALESLSKPYAVTKYFCPNIDVGPHLSRVICVFLITLGRTVSSRLVLQFYTPLTSFFLSCRKRKPCDSVSMFDEPPSKQS